jgi:phosphoribosylaminoimidazole carboxylase
VLGAFDPSIQRKVESYAEAARAENMELKGTKMRELGWQKYFDQM